MLSFQNVCVELCENLPINVSLKLGGRAQKVGSIIYLLAGVEFTQFEYEN